MENNNDIISRCEEHQKITNRLLAIFKAKDKDYGNSFDLSLNKHGLVAGVIRIGDKMNRLESLCDKESEKQVEESLEDTLLDMANYCILSVMWLHRQK